jgi:hypothetical protein
MPVMTSLIESLIGDPLFRQDAQRILPVRRPLPERPRDLLEVFSAMGGEASRISLLRSLDLRDATPGWLIFVALNRWPTMAELRALEGEYDARKHLSALIFSVEFRRLLAQRILTAYPEKVRLLYVRIPRCAGSHFLATARLMHPVFADEIAAPTPRPGPAFFPMLGLLLARFLSTRTVMLEQPRLAPYYQPPAFAAPEAGSLPPPSLPPPSLPPPSLPPPSLPWTMELPPYRAGDRLFTIVRDPEAIILSQVNAIVEALRARAADEPAGITSWRNRLGGLPEDADAQAWVPVARQVLAAFADADPICHALGDGTTQGALEACAVTNIEIADLSRYDEWITRTWETRTPPPAVASPVVLPREALTAAELDRLAALTAQDRPLYVRIRAALDGAELSSIKGLQLL